MRVYKYGAKPPTNNVERVEQVLLLAHRYRNALVEVERHRRAANAAIVAGLPGDELLVTRLRRACIRLASARARMLAKSLRAMNGLSGSWGSYLLVEQAVDAAKSSGEELRFRRWDEIGRVGVQLQGGLVVADAIAGTDTRLRIDPQPDLPGTRLGGIKPGSRRAGRKALVHIRVDSAGRKPVWATWPVTLGRPLPPGGIIKWAWMQRSRIGPHLRWDLCLTVDESSCSQRLDVEADRAGTVAVDLGWRMRPDGMRVGYWRDDTVRHGELVLPEDYLTDFDHARSIGALRDRLANDFRDQLVAWRAANEAGLPEWFLRATETLAQWRSANRLATFLWRWKQHRFVGDEAVFDTAPGCTRDEALNCVNHVECYRRKDRHLHAWHAHKTAKVIARRDELYKRWSATFTRHYAHVLIEDFDLRRVAGRRGLDSTATDGEKAKADNASSRRHVGAPGTFRLWLLNACRARETVVEAVNPAWTTIDCASCGFREPWDPAVSIDHRCGRCGDTWDQDDQACANLLARASSEVVRGGGEPLAGGMSVRQQRFRSKRKASGDTRAAPGQDRSREETEVREHMAEGSKTVDDLAQEV